MVVSKEVDVGLVDVDIEVELEDFETGDLIKEIIDRCAIDELLEKIDAEANDWEFTGKARDYFVAEMAKHESLIETN